MTTIWLMVLFAFAPDPWTVVPGPPDPWTILVPVTLPAPVLVRAASGPTPNDRQQGDARIVSPQSADVGSVAGMSREEAKAIDARALARYGWKLCQGSCGMACASHGGGLKWLLLSPGEQPSQGEAGMSDLPPQRRTHTEYRRAGLFGRRTITVEVDDPPEKEKQQPDGTRDVSSFPLSPTATFGASGGIRRELNPVAVESDGRPAAASSCPGGVCPLGRY